MQDASEALEDAMQTLRGELVQGVPTLLDELDRHLDTIVGRRREQNRQQLEREELMHNLLVDKMRQEP